MTRDESSGLHALQTAINLCGGSRRELARRIACYIPRFSGQRINNWIARGETVPVELAPFVSDAVGGQVSVYDLCPGFEEGWRLLREQLTRDGHDRAETV